MDRWLHQPLNSYNYFIQVVAIQYEFDKVLAFAGGVSFPGDHMPKGMSEEAARTHFLAVEVSGVLWTRIYIAFTFSC